MFICCEAREALERRLSASFERFWERWCRRSAKRDGSEDDWEAGVERPSWGLGGRVGGAEGGVGFDVDAGVSLVGGSIGFRVSSSKRLIDVVKARRTCPMGL